MKELTIEEKAARYDEVIETFDVILNLNTVKKSGTIFTDDVRKILPELKESEGDGMRRGLLAFLKENLETGRAEDTWSLSNIEKWISWLEKQCEPFTKKDVDDAYLKGVRDAKSELKKQGGQNPETNFLKFRIGDKVTNGEDTYTINFIGKDCYWVKEHDCATIPFEYQHHWKLVEQKPVDKVEPKFKVGDWVIRKDVAWAACCITQIHEQYYLTNYHTFISFREEGKYRLWTIEDAKDGDVLYSIDSKQPFIYKERPQFSQAIGYCCINIFGEFAIWNTSKCVICTDKYIPATKEQRDTLEKAMADAGYTFNFEKKELKKIEQKSADEEMERLLQPEYEKVKAAIIKAVTKDKESAINFLKSAGIINDNGKLAKEYVIDNIEQNPAWSEEDESMLQNILECLKNGWRKLPTDVLKYESWLQSIKDRIQPKRKWSEEDSRILYNIKAYIGYAAGQRGVKDELFKEANEWLNSLPIGFIYNKNYNEDMVTLLVSELKQIADDNNVPEQYKVEINWLKSLRPQSIWKPSDEQIMALRFVLNHMHYDSHKEEIHGLLEQLKKLKNE